jgi:hypothetical protein
MKFSPVFNYFARLSAFAFFAAAGLAPGSVQADLWSNTPSQPGQSGAAGEGVSQSQQMFASPDDAVKALRTAIEANNTAALGQIFGPDFQSLQTGDKVQDTANRRHFAGALEESCQLEKQSDTEYFVDVGTNNWPMPIPLIQANGQWYFDTVAGKEEIIDRHIGRDELTAIGVCRAYVDAQRQFATMSGGTYAQKFKSTPGKRDGLYWPTAAGEPSSPFGALVAEAHMEGYGGHSSTGLHAFHGYYFRILTAQGRAAPGGKMDYLSDGVLKNGFALVAYPENWNQSGVMTFIVGQDGKVYQRDFGDKTERVASKIKEYNPDKEWSLVQDDGVRDAVMEKE